jgi:hypothetical protein
MKLYPERTLQERFDEKWTPEPNSGCWLWLGSNDSRLGYGKMYFQGRNQMATKVAWFLKHNEIPDSKYDLCHRCDTPACVNPDHLFLGTPSDNQLDSIRKGRHRYSRGYGTDWNKARKRKVVRKEFCKNGHPLSGENLYICPKQWAQCKECRRQQVYAFKKRQRQ